MQASKLLIKGTVQGVGFRPTVYRLATQLGLKGWVKNTSKGVEVVINTAAYQVFLASLAKCLPRLAKIDTFSQELINLTLALDDFTIAENSNSLVNDTLIPADSCSCAKCIAEIFDPNSRYYLYPFTNCCDCGPRYSVISDLPYTRANTALANFPLCADCYQEFSDPRSRRYHAQAMSCHNCGPQLDLDLASIAKAISSGNIVALKTTGGYVLITEANNSIAVNELRKRKARKAKPFALMALNVVSIKDHYCQVNPHEQQLLEASEAPIVILERRLDEIQRAQEIAPNLTTLGFMLANSPIYYLLFYYLLGQPKDLAWLKQSHALALVITSANLSGGCIIHQDHEARKELHTVADIIIGYNREIVMQCDDSVILALKDQDVLIRRARGYAPQPYSFKYKLPQVLGLGTQLKSSVCFTRDNHAYLSQHLGDMGSEPVIKYLQKVLQHYKDIFNFTPQLVVSDLHPDFHTTLLAQECNLPQLQLQHHYAHLAATIASVQSFGHELRPQIIGCILDGYGYGIDGSSWGGELIKFNLAELEFTHMSQLPGIIIPGGSDSAETEPWKLALAWCLEHNLAPPPHLARLPQADLVASVVKNKFSTQTSSAGRLFSLVSALLGVCLHSSYEAEAALRLEAKVTQVNLESNYANLSVDGQPDISLLLEKIYHLVFSQGKLVEAINTFYANLGTLLSKWIVYHALAEDVSQVALGGGCWQSRYLLPLVQKNLRQQRIDLLIPERLPFNDEAISFGQAWYGAQYLLLGKTKCV